MFPDDNEWMNLVLMHAHDSGVPSGDGDLGHKSNGSGFGGNRSTSLGASMMTRMIVDQQFDVWCMLWPDLGEIECLVT